MVKVDLINPRHNLAPPVSEQSQSYIYIPTSLFSVASRLMERGVEVKLHDENISPRQLSSNIVGLTLVGPAYIPEVIQLQKEISKSIENPTFLLGGQVISGLTKEQFKRLFGRNSYNGNEERVLEQILGVKSIPKADRTSLIPAYELIDDLVMRQYLENEFSLYVSQGCKFCCSFCGADRTSINPVSKTVKKRGEVYRSPEIIEEELEYLVRRARSLGINQFNIYMSNLDVFQTPNKLLDFAYAVLNVKSRNPGFEINLRGLSTAKSFLTAKEELPQSIEVLIKAGFHRVGFGVDGITPRVWKAVNKGINTEDECLEAIRVAREFGITPEILMVFGHPGIDTEESLRLAYEFTLDMVGKYGAIPRPHVAKSIIPGNDGWLMPENANVVEALLSDPELFQALDFTALPSTLTHPDQKLRELATKYYLKICNIEGNTTLYTKPITPELTQEEKQRVRRFNLGRYDR